MNERDMIELLLQKNERGMDALLKKCGPMMRYIIASILPNELDREDCLSEAAMRVWEQVERFDPRRGSWSAWVTAVTRNTALNYKRSLSRLQNAEALPENAPAPEPAPESRLLRRERQEEVGRALGQLSPRDRALFYRKYYYLQSTAQIASEMGLTERAVEGKLYRLKKRLRKMLGGDGYDRS